jgi:hypothetical protein
MEVLYNILFEFRIPMKHISLIKRRLNETYSRVWVDKHTSDMFSIKTGMRQGDALSPLLLNFVLQPWFSIYFSSWKPKNLQNLLRNTYLSIIRQTWNWIPIFVCLLCILHVNNKCPASNWSVTSSLAWHIDCLWRALPTDLTTESGSFWTEAAIDCMRAISDGMIGVACRHTNFNSYTQI